MTSIHTRPARGTTSKIIRAAVKAAAGKRNVAIVVHSMDMALVLRGLINQPHLSDMRPLIKEFSKYTWTTTVLSTIRIVTAKDEEEIERMRRMGRLVFIDHVWFERARKARGIQNYLERHGTAERMA